jgi:Na+-transporting NADH:ubiquinone oxidoreductase subunit C
MKAQGTGYVLFFAAAISVVCSLAIAGTAMGLRPLQQKNIDIDKKKNVLAAAGMVVVKEKVLKTFAAQVKARVIDLKSGAISDVSIASLSDAQLAADIYRLSDAQANLRPLYIVGGGAEQVTIIPIAGKGLWSTVYGFLALRGDHRTVKGISFYKHGETPGLGAECEKEWFTSNFIGKTLSSPDGKPVFGVAKGKASAATCTRYGGVDHCVDGISGATITSNGITELVNRAMRDYSGFFAAQKG